MSSTAPTATRQGADFEVRLPVFEGPLQLLLHLVESRQVDLMTVPLADIADAYVGHLASHAVDPAQLADFVAVAAQLILLKSRHLLPGDPGLAPTAAGDDDVDEEQLRRRLIAYRALRDAAAALGRLDGASPAYAREPRESDLPEAPPVALDPSLLVAALEALAQIQEPVPPQPEVVPREVTIGEQIARLRAALGATGSLVLQGLLAGSRSRTEAAVTFMATLELARRREVRVEQRSLFGPIVVERLSGPDA
jgi:segregation and condensation protein A